jgi:hypothetical protein
MGLPKEFHEQCEWSIEVRFLKVVNFLPKQFEVSTWNVIYCRFDVCFFFKEFYCWAQAAVFNTADKIVNSNVTIPEERACSAAVRLMFQILSWNFKHTVEHDNSDAKINSGLRNDTINLKKFERSLVKVLLSKTCIFAWFSL